MKIFLTGGTGFIGLPLVKRMLQEDNQLMILSRKEPTFFESVLSQEEFRKVIFVQGDLSLTETYEKALLNFQPEMIYHLAWTGIPDHGPEMSTINLQNGLNLLKVATRSGCRALLCTGSCWEYGTVHGPLHGELDEEALTFPRDSFGAAKTALRLIGQELAKKNQFDFVWTRFFYVYGPGQREKSLIPTIISSVRRGIEPEIKTPFTKNDFVYVKDVAEALYSFVQYYQKYPKERLNGIYNIGSGCSTQVQEMVQKVRSYFGKEYTLRRDRQEMIIDFWSSNQKLEKLTGWKPKTSLDDGIKEMCHLAEKK